MQLKAMKEHCRICLCENEDLISIYNETFDQVYSALTSIVISADNRLSQKVCLNCATYLRKVQTFKELCLESHRITSSSKDTLISFVDVKEEEIEDTKEELEVAPIVTKDVKSESKEELAVVPKKKAPNHLRCPYPQCKRFFFQQLSYKNHLKTHTGEQSDVCDICGQSFACYKNLRRHMYIHEGIKKYPCRHCEISFRSTYGRSVHENSIHTKERTYVCHICGVSFYNPQAMAIHRNRHFAVKQYECNECGKLYKTKAELKLHFVIHTRIRNFSCNICQAKFMRNHDLKKHKQLVHNPTRDFKCNECDKTYKRKIHLEDHLRSHTGEKPYVCEVCDKAFATKNVLHKHTFIHTGSRHNCTKCTSSYAELYRLKKHVEREHPE